jgi:DNA-binding beta-propeller fold protein YncE
VTQRCAGSVSKRTVFSVLLVYILVGVSGILRANEAPYVSYIYDYWGQTAPAPRAYLPERIVTGQIGDLGGLIEPRDVFVQNNKIYLADTGNKRIIVFDDKWEIERVIDGFVIEGTKQGFSDPFGLHVTPDGTMFIADRNAARIVVLTQEGNLLRILGAPPPDEDGVIPEDFRYRPRKVAVDQAGRIYVVAEDVYDGILEFDADGAFRGFVGAPRVRLNIAQYLWRLVSTQAQRERMQLFLPTEYSNLDIDERGFIYTTVASSNVNELDVIRRLNPSGADVLRRRGFSPPMGDYGSVFLDEDGQLVYSRSAFVDVVAREYGVYSALDRTRGRVFTYDGEGNLLYVFGGIGNQRGTFQVPSALATLGDKLLVLDAVRNELTVFRPTLYAKLIHAAIESHYTGQYDAARELWSQVLSLNGNYDLAYTGIGQALLRTGRYREAMDYFRAGQNREDYSEAFQLYRREILMRNFGRFMQVLLSVWILSLVNGKLQLTTRGRSWFADLSSRARSQASQELSPRQAAFIRYLDSLGYALYVVRHPFDGFWDLKHEKRGTVQAAVTLVALLSLVFVFMRQYTGFIFNTRRLTEMNVFVEFGSVLVPVILWMIVSWSLTTLMEGKGTFRDIVIATAYALTPLIIINFPLTIISGYLTLQEGVFYYIFLAISILWAGGLLIIGTMLTHDYSMKKTLLTCFLTIIGILVVLFIALLMIGVMGQVVAWVRDIYREILFRL